jgi:hypothetical protein
MPFMFSSNAWDGAPAGRPTFRAVTPTWHAGDTIFLGPGRILRVLGVRDEDADQAPVLVVEATDPSPRRRRG